MKHQAFKHRPYGTAVGVGAVALTILSGALVAGSVTATDVDAAPNPYMGKEATHTVTISDDGSYRVHIAQTMQLALDADFSFGGTIHDGFRLPETQSVLPPYLRAHYSNPKITMDGEPAKVKVEQTFHAVDIAARGSFTEGEHEGTVDYRVTGAAVPAADVKTDSGGVAVYLRPLLPGDVILKSAEPITAVECEEWPAHGQHCGHRAGDDWLIAKDELDDNTIVRITLDADDAELIEPDIDAEK